MKNRPLVNHQLNQKQNIHTIDFTNEGGIFVFPYSMISGSENVSESGILSDGTRIDSASTVLSVFTGRDAIKVCWDNSTQLSPYAPNPNLFQYDFKIGDFFIGKPISGRTSSGAEISNFASEDDFIALKSASTITFQFEYPTSEEHPNGYSIEDYMDLAERHQLIVRDASKRKFYKIPELGENKWYYITSSDPIFNDKTGLIIGEIIEFSTVIDQLQNSGRAVEQYIQNNAPGEPYASPLITRRIGLQGEILKSLTLNTSTSTWGENKLIKYIQVEQQGTSITGGINIFGRRIFYDKNINKWVSHPWSWLLPSNFYQFNNNPLNKTSLPTSTYAFLPSMNLRMYMTIDWMEQWKKINDSLSTMHCAGRIVLGEKGDWQGEDTTKTHLSNPDNLEYWNTDWNPYWKDNAKTFDMQGSIYTADTLSYKKTDTFTNIFIKNSFRCLNNLLLPVELERAKPYRVSNLPIIGNLISAFIGDRTIFANKTGKYFEGIGGFVDKTYLGELVGLGLDNQEPIQSFLSALGGEMIPKGFGATSYNTSFCYKLTNKLTQEQEGIRRSILTEYLAQTKDENGNPILEGHEDVACRLQDDFDVELVDYGFVIDKIMVHSLFSGNVRITCYGTNFSPEYATTVVSNTKWLENAYNNWTTELSLGTWPSAYVSEDYNPTWPEQPQFKGGDYPLNIQFIDNLSQGVRKCCFDGVASNMFWDSYTTTRAGVKVPNYTQVGTTPLFSKVLSSGFTKQFSYGQTGQYDDRDDYISKVKSLKFDIKNSTIGFTKCDTGDFWDAYSSTKTSNEEIVAFELQQGVYEYENDFIFGFIDGEESDETKLMELHNNEMGTHWNTCIQRLYGINKEDFANSYYGYGTKLNSTLEEPDLGTCKGYIKFHCKLTLGETLEDGFFLNFTDIKVYRGNTNHDYEPVGVDGNDNIERALWRTWSDYRGVRTEKSSRMNLSLTINSLVKENR